MKFTDRGIDNLDAAPAGTRVEWWDAAFPAFGVRVSGRIKTFQFMYRHDGRLRRMTLGRYGVIKLADAREAAFGAKKLADAGEDPAAKKEEGGDTIRDLFDTFAATRKQAANRTAAEIRRTFEREVFPTLGDKPAASIKKSDIRDVIAKVDARAPIAANRLLSYLKTFFGWLTENEHVSENVTAGMKKPADEVARERYLSDDEIKEFWAATGQEPGPFGAALRLLLLTGARREEILQATKAELQGDALVLSGDRTKTGKSREVPLSTLAREVLAGLEQHKGKYLISTTNGERPFSGVSRALERINAHIMDARYEAAADKDAVQPMEEWRVHDLRRTCSTGLQALGVGLQVSETLLGHLSGSRSGVAGVYHRFQFRAEAKAAAELWGEHIRKLVGR